MESVESNLARRERALEPETRSRYFAALEGALRDDDTYVVLAWIIGGFGAHRFYLGQPGKGFAHLALFPTGVALLVAGLATQRLDLGLAGGFLMLLDLGYWIHDLVKFREIVDERNREIRRGLLDRHERS